MTTGEFADLVESMRKAQKKYFKTHSLSELETAKTLEKRVDSLLADRGKREEERVHPSLFQGMT